MELAGSLAVATAGVLAAGSAGGVIAAAQGVTLGLALARRIPSRGLVACAVAFGAGYLLATARTGAPLAPPGTPAGPGPNWAAAAVGVGFAAVALWTLLGRSHLVSAGADAAREGSIGGVAASSALVGVVVALLGGVLTGWMRPAHAGPALALLTAAPASGGAALRAAGGARAALLYHAGTAAALAVGLAVAGAGVQRLLAAVRLGWIGSMALFGWGALCAAGWYERAVEAVLRYWPLRGLG